jgi:hypothetical protein
MGNLQSLCAGGHRDVRIIRNDFARPDYPIGSRQQRCSATRHGPAYI